MTDISFFSCLQKLEEKQMPVNGEMTDIVNPWTMTHYFK